MNKAPGFMFYPDKWDSHTRHLSDSAYRTFHRMLCWMWQHAPDQCSITRDPAGISVLLQIPQVQIEDALCEILNPVMPLLRSDTVDKSNGLLVSKGLQKEAQKQSMRRHSAVKAANARWSDSTTRGEKGNAETPEKECERTGNGKNPHSIPIPLPVPIPDPNEVSGSTLLKSPLVGGNGAEARQLHQTLVKAHPDLKRITFEMFWRSCEKYPKADAHEAVDSLVRKSAADLNIRSPISLLESYLSKSEVKLAGSKTGLVSILRDE